MPCGVAEVSAFEWSVNDPDACTFSNYIARRPSVLCNKPGSYTLTLKGGWPTGTLPLFYWLYADTATLTVVMPHYVYLPLITR